MKPLMAESHIFCICSVVQYSVLQTCPVERDLRIRLPSLWAVGGGGTHDWKNTLVIGRHCSTVVIVTMDWSVRQQGFCQKWQQKMVWGILPWHIQLQCSLVALGKKTWGKWINSCMRRMDQFLYEKDTSSVCGIFVKMGLLWSVVSGSYCMLVPVHV